MEQSRNAGSIKPHVDQTTNNLDGMEISSGKCLEVPVETFDIEETSSHYRPVPISSVAEKPQKLQQDSLKHEANFALQETEQPPTDVDKSNLETYSTHSEEDKKDEDALVKDVSKSDVALSALSHLNLEKGNFFKGCKWAPDGLCLMTCSDDNVIRLINTPREILSKNWDSCSQSTCLNSCLHIREAEIIYDFTWWPLMNSMHPETCCFVTTAKDQPIHLWDAFNGELRATYIAKNNVDEVAAAHCVNFSPDGIQMICGFRKDLRIFYIDRPGTSCEVWPTRSHKKATGQKGILSTCEFNFDATIIACGSYDGTVALYSSKNGDLAGLFNSNSKGITHVRFSSDGNRIYSGSRKDNNIICWDIRYSGKDLFHMDRQVDTNQRIYFDIGAKSCRDSVTEDVLVSGGSDGVVSFWDLPTSSDATYDESSTISPLYKHQAHRDCVNGVNIHPFLPVLATSSGQRHFGCFSSSGDDSDSEPTEFEENCLKLWHISGWAI